MRLFLSSIAAVLLAVPCFAQSDTPDKFRQLEELLPTPGLFRTASGAPGGLYWQQRADHVIDVEIDDDSQRLRGSETIAYTNNSPDTLRYLWVQLDQNLFSPQSDSFAMNTAPDFEELPYKTLKYLLERESFLGGMKVTSVNDTMGTELRRVIVGTMMRIDLDEPLISGAAFEFGIDWEYNIVDAKTIRARGGYEFFEEDGNYLYEIAQWFPRMAAYTDVHGWQHKQFLGRGEFTLEFGDYDVRITVPADHIVAATGVLQNAEEVLTEAQRARYQEAETSRTPVFIVTPEEALEAQKTKSADKKTWVFHAERVRDFAFATSRKFIWDAMPHESGDTAVMAMSYYPNEGEPLWSRYSTHSIVHTLDVYSKFTFDYPYPIAISVNGPIGGMEYPMICFNGPRPEEDGTYSKRTKYGLISVIIHEVGHNYFPMIVNSDERRWTWMDEGLNTFVQYLAEQEWEQDYPSWRGEPQKITGYMGSDNQVPIMTHSESILQFGNNAYAKPATALNILRETVMGRELFDFAFREYARRWMFKRPMPADFFRSMEDASAVDLDWFWRGWFYTTDHCDIAIGEVQAFELDTRNPDVDKARLKEDRDEEPVTVAERANRRLDVRVAAFAELKDFYNEYDDLDVTAKERREFEELIADLEDDEKRLLGLQKHFLVVEFQNIGGLVMPIIVELEFADGSKREVRLPAEIWVKNSESVSKLFMTDQEIVHVTLDPHLETADTDLGNNQFPPTPVKTRFQLFKEKKRKNPMQKVNAEEERAAEQEQESATKGE